MGSSMALVEGPAPEIRTAILTQLIAFNKTIAGSARYEQMALTLRDEETGAVVGGLYGEFVPKALRGTRHGTRLMQEAEALTQLRGGTVAWLDTFSFQARGFYERLGYQCFGELPGHPRGGSRFFVQKGLVASASA